MLAIIREKYIIVELLCDRQRKLTNEWSLCFCGGKTNTDQNE
jgi:hypothetical protein